MKKGKKSDIVLGYKFTRSYYFKIWRIVCKFKKYTNPTWYTKYTSKSQKYSYYSPVWIKKVIIPSKAFHHWLKINDINEDVFDRIFNIGKKYLPLKVKLFLKKNAPAYFPAPIRPIPHDIQARWDAWSLAKPDTSIDIINFGVIAYDYRIQRPQHVARELTNLGHRVFYIENEFIFSSLATRPQIEVKSKDKNIFAVKLSSS